MKSLAGILIMLLVGSSVTALSERSSGANDAVDACGLVQIHKDLVALEKEIRASPPYHHADGHDGIAIADIQHASKELNEGCAAYKHTLQN